VKQHKAFSKKWNDIRNQVLGDWIKPRRNIFTRIRLWRILRAMGIKRLYPQQEAYVFGAAVDLREWPRGSGKTTACLVYLLMWYRGTMCRWSSQRAEILKDPDYYPSSTRNRLFHQREIDEAHEACVLKRIKVFELKPFSDAYRRVNGRRWWRPC